MRAGKGPLHRGAFDKLLVAHLPGLLRFAIRLTGNAATGEDLAQETVVRAMNSAATLRESERFGAWLFQIAVNCFRDSLRRAGPVVMDVSDEALVPLAKEDPATLALTGELGEAVAAAVSTLPPRQREVLVLVAYEGFTTIEAAELLGISDQNARTTLHLARQKLREKLSAYLTHPRMPLT